MQILIYTKNQTTPSNRVQAQRKGRELLKAYLSNRFDALSTEVVAADLQVADGGLGLIITLDRARVA